MNERPSGGPTHKLKKRRGCLLYIEPNKYREVRVGIEKQILERGLGMDLCREVSSRWQRTALESRFLHLYSLFLHMIIEQRQAEIVV